MSTSIEIREQKQKLERRAEVVRSRLFRAVDALDARRHQVERITTQAKELALPTVLSVAAIGLLLGASALAVGAVIKRRRRVSLLETLAETVRGLGAPRRPSFARRAAERVVLSLVTFAATEVVRRATKNLVDGRLLDGRLAVGPALEAHHTEIQVR